jgi:hypothetical protein
MKNFVPLIFICLILISCSNNKTDINPSASLSIEEQNDFKYEIIRYTGKIAPKATENTKFNSEFDEYYKNLAQKHDLIAFYTDKINGYDYFMLTRIAPSIHLRKVAIGGKVSKDENGTIIYYEEAFRTYKMPENELREKAEMLFHRYISGQDLEKYHYKNTQPDEYIEFPNEETWYDAEKRQWISSRFDPLQEFIDMRD